MKKSQVRKDMAKMFVQALKERPYNWSKGFSSLASPVNAVSGNRYSNYNRFILSMHMLFNDYEDPRFYSLSYIFGSSENRGKEWGDPTKIKVKKGESPVYIDSSFFVPTEKGKEQGLKPISMREYMLLEQEEKELYRSIKKPIALYNAQQLTGVPEYTIKKLELTEKEIAEALDRAASNMDLTVKESVTVETPCYSPATDTVKLPPAAAFENEYSYFSVKLHEFAHATGHQSRLGRDLTGRFGSEEYATEELRAEIASCFMASEFGVEPDEKQLNNHKAYIQSWISAIEDDENVLVSAIFDAEKIADFIEKQAEPEIDISLEDEEMEM